MNRLSIIAIVVFLIGGLVIIQSTKKRALSKRNLLFNEGGFAIGTFESRNLSNGRTYSISFNYTVEKQKYSGGDTRCYLDSPIASDAFTNKDLAKKDDAFLVLYKKTNPDISIIRLDYPIKDSIDFRKYIKEIEQKRKKN